MQKSIFDPERAFKLISKIEELADGMNDDT